MKSKEFKEWLETLKEELGEGYFILSINGFTSYIYYNYKEQEFDLIFSSNSLSVDDLKYQLEKRGKKITEISNSERDMLLDKYNSYLQSTNQFFFDYEDGFYKIKEHQLSHVAEWARQNQLSGIFSYYDEAKLNKSVNYKYDQKKIEKSKRQKIS